MSRTDSVATEPAPRQGSVLWGTGPTARLLQATGLLLVAVLAGLLWWVIRHDPVRPVAHPVPSQQRTGHTQGPLTDGDYDYTVADGPAQTADCVPHSYGEIHDWFDDHPCEQLDRGLYTTTDEDGNRALVSVSVVTMPTHDEASELYDMAFDDGTGNISDLARESAELPSDAPKVSDGEYKSKIVGSRVTIVEANFFADAHDGDELTHIAGDARRLSELLA